MSLNYVTTRAQGNLARLHHPTPLSRARALCSESDQWRVSDADGDSRAPVKPCACETRRRLCWGFLWTVRKRSSAACGYLTICHWGGWGKGGDPVRRWNQIAFKKSPQTNQGLIACTNKRVPSLCLHTGRLRVRFNLSSDHCDRFKSYCSRI